jgi:hypothetical protein
LFEPVVIDEDDPKGALWGKIRGIIRSRRVKQEMAKHGIEPVNLAGVIFKIVLIDVFLRGDFVRGRGAREKERCYPTSLVTNFIRFINQKLQLR